MGFREALLVARARWATIVAVMLAVVGITAGLTLLAPNTYSSKTQMFVSVNGGESTTDLVSGSTFAQNQVQSYVDVVRSPLVLQPVIDSLKITNETPSSLAKKLTVSVPEQTVLMNLTVTDSDPTRASLIANAVTAQFIKTVADLGASSASSRLPVKVTVLESAVC